VKYSLLWLKEFVDFTETPAEIASLLLKQGFEVPGFSPVGGAVTGVVVARVETAQKHPNADKLKLCEVFDGVTHFQVVCGAPNVEAGKRYSFARLGATLPDGLTIEKRPLRGIESHGMLCSARELGLGADHSGLYLLPDDAPLGQEITETLSLNDVVMEVEVTPNRPDVLSHWGLAREIGAALGKKIKTPDLKVPQGKPQPGLARIDEPTLCDRYVARVFENVKLGPSPLWMRLRLERCGVRSINNLVDVTNYVMLEFGHPLHVFDRDRLMGEGVVVRLGKPGEKLECLDGVTRDVSEVLVIADNGGPLAVAGVMGGQPSGVSDETHSVFLESAHFLPAQVRRARGRLNVSTESSYRFERGTDPEMADMASRRATGLILSLAGGILTGEKDAGETPLKPKPIDVSLERMTKLLGLPLSTKDAMTALASFCFSCEEQGGHLRVTPPLHRADVRETPDVVEEVARRIGYDHIPGRVRAATSEGDPLPAVRSLARQVRDRLMELGFWEAAHSGLVPKELWDRLAGDNAEVPPLLANPLSSTGECLNPSLLVNLLGSLEGNVRRGNRNVRLFEFARVFHQGKNTVIEADHIAWVATGQNHSNHWKFRARPLEIWDARSWAKILFKDIRLMGIKFETGALPFLHPVESQSIRMGDQILGFYGRLHPRQAEAWALPPDTFVSEWDLSLASTGKFLEVKYEGLSRQPALVRDFSLVFPERVSWTSIVLWIHQHCEWVEGVELFDVFTGAELPEGTRSLAFHVTFRHPDRTVSETEAQSLQEIVLTGLGKEYGAHLRAPLPPSPSPADEKDVPRGEGVKLGGNPL
jgi:phenylalanyl-tRNA synthetase beta chain